MQIITHTIKIPAILCIRAVLCEYEEAKEQCGLDAEATHTHTTSDFHYVDVVGTSLGAIYTLGLIVGSKMRQAVDAMLDNKTTTS